MSAAPTFPPDYREPQQPPRPPRFRPRWKKVVAWIAGGITVVVVVVVLAVLALLHNQSFHEYLLRVAQEKATAALGLQVRVQDYVLRFSGVSPSLDLYGLVVHGAPPYSNPPLLQVDHIHVGVRVVSLLSRKWHLEDVRADHPVVRVFVDRHGTNNLPQAKSSQQQGKASVFDLGVRHVLLERGEVYYNNRKSVMNADLHELNFQSAFDTARRSYSGTLSYRDGHLQLENFRPMPHDLDAQFTAAPNTFTLQHAALRSGPSQFVLTATLEDYVHPKVQAKYEAVIDSGEFRRVTKNASLPVGVVRAAGSLLYVSQPNRPMLETVTLNGDLSSRELHIYAPGFRVAIRDIGARYTVGHGNLDARDMRARLLGGELTGMMTMRDITGASRSQLKAALHGVSLTELKGLMSSPALRQLALNGTLNVEANATWGRTTNDLVARADATINANLAPANAAGNAVPLNGVIRARYAAPTRQLALTQTYLRTPQTMLTLNGTMSERSSLKIRLQANDLHELEPVAEAFSSRGQAPPGLFGTASFVGAVRGSTAAPQLKGQLTAANVRVKGSAWRLLRTQVNVSPSFVGLQNGVLEPAQRGRITFNLNAGLRQWSFTETSPIQANLSASQIAVGSLAKVAGVQTPIVGTLSADIALHGSELNPIGQGNISLTQVKLANEPIQSLNLKFNGTGDAVHANLVLRLPAGTAKSVLTYFPKQRGYDVQLEAKSIRLDQLQTIKQRNMQLNGVLNLAASGRGTLSNPKLTARLELPELEIRNQRISRLTLQAAVADHIANVALDSQVVDTYVRGRATVNLTGDYYANAALDTQAVPLEPLVATSVPSQAGNITGQTELHATLRGPLKNKALLEAHVTIPTLAVNYKQTVQIGAPSPIQVDYTNGVLQLQRAVLRGTGTDLQFQGTVPVTSNAPASLLLLGTIDLRLAQVLNPDIASSGQLRFNINSYGRSHPNVEGQIEIVNANFATGTLPIGLQKGNGVLTLMKDRLHITQFEGLVGGGKVTASGGVVYRPSLQFDLAMAGNGVRLLYNGIRTGLDTKLALSGSTQAALLQGQVRIDELQFTPDFDLMDFMGQLGGGTAPPPTGGFTQNLQLDIGVASSGGVNLVSRTLSVQGTANLRVSGTAVQPVILGRVNLTGGDLIFTGNRYVLQSGTLDFVNPTRTQPVVNVAVNTTIEQYDIQMRFWGPADHLNTHYSSDPALPPSEIINLIAFGKTTEAAAANPMPGKLGAQSLVASQVSSQVSSRVEKIAGVSQLTVDPVLGGGQQNPGARVAIQQRVTGKMFVTFATDVTSTQRQVIKLDYQVTPRVSVSATRDQNGGFGFDTRIRKTW